VPAPADRRRPGNQIVHGLIGQAGNLNIEQRKVDVLAVSAAITIPVAMRQRSENGVAGVETGGNVGQGETDFLRAGAGLAVRRSGDTHQASHALNQEVVAGAGRVRPVLSKAGDRAISEFGVERTHAVLLEAVGGQATALEVLDQHVGVARQLANDLLPLGSGGVDCQRALVAVGAQQTGGLARRLAIAVGQPRRPPAARVVATTGPLDLDRLGAEVDQQLPGPGAGENASQVEHA
jgi:hypothetical protein